MTENPLTSKTINEIIDEKFYIPDYQRGYRWTELQVRQLLDDIYDFNYVERDGKPYCLQPVVVMKKEDGSWETIDGQQRLTTIYIILAYLGQKRYELVFQTRLESWKFLEGLTGEVSINFDNIDFFHISSSFNVVKSWFEEKEKQKATIKSAMHICIGEQVKVIWYEIQQENVVPVEMFTRLNIGKIQLTNSELIKALLLSQQNFMNCSAEHAHLKKSRIATEWDWIEQELHQRELWAFLTPKYLEISNRIDFLFAFHAELAEVSVKNEYDIFEHFEKRIKQDGADKVWEDVQSSFLRLREWFNTPDTFHLCGYLITIGYPLLQLYKQTAKLKKSEMKRHLLDEIANKTGFGKNNIRNLDYENHHKEITNLLLLFNIITVQKSSQNTEKFSFYRYKNQSWSLEHIHAQNPDGLTTEKQWGDWLKDHKAGLLRIKTEENAELITELVAKIDNILGGKIRQVIFNPLFAEIVPVFKGAGKEVEVHSLGNMALLDKDSNSSLNNSVFEVKRNIIIERDKAGKFILPATRNVFLKYYTEHPEHNSYWTELDQKEYVNKIEETIRIFLRGDR